MDSSGLKTFFVSIALGLFGLIVFGLLWFFFLGPNTPVGFGWYLFSFAAGLTMIVLPCTLPLAFVIVPLALGKSPAKGLGLAIAFGLGVAITLSMYGVLAAVVGEVAIGTIGAPLETVKNWLYLVAGIFAYLFALGELGFIRFRMPSYSGAAPAFIQRQGDYIKALMLGLFLGNIGVGCPHPATPIILTRIAASGDVFYGWLLFFVHAAGRVLPLLLLALLAILGVNALTWLLARKEKMERATGWGMVFVAAFILVLGLFTHDWWVYSGQHTLLEELTGEETFLNIIAKKLGTVAPHHHGIPTGTGLFGFPLWLGNWVLVLLWVLPIWWFYFKRKAQSAGRKIDEDIEAKVEARIMPYRFWLAIVLTLLLALTFIWVLPDRFLNHSQPVHVEMRQMTMPEEMAHAHGAAVYHEESDVLKGLVVNLNVSPVPLKLGIPTKLDFFVNQKPENSPLPFSALEIEHTKLMHVLGVRSDLNEFFHIHAEPTKLPGVMSVNHLFPRPGRYKIWSEVKKDGVVHTFGHPEITVVGGGLREEKVVDFGRNAILENYQVSLAMDEPVVKNKEAHLSLVIRTVTGQDVALEDYLAAKMHLTIIKDDSKQFIHTHPEEREHHEVFHIFPEVKAHEGEEAVPGGAVSKSINFHVTFPEAGLYKAFAQFRPQGIDLAPDDALTAAFWLEVEEKPEFGFKNKWFLTAASLVLIALLSWGVKKYLRQDLV